MTLLLHRTPRTETVRPDSMWPAWLSTRPFVDWPTMTLFGEEPEMRIEEFAEDGRIVVRAELPGIDPDRDVEITVADHTLTIRAERTREEQVEEKDGFRSEFAYGSFVRTMPLPTGATEDDITATYRDGILEVQVPVAATAETRKVEVTRS
jgi:HSP20 family protein